MRRDRSGVFKSGNYHDYHDDKISVVMEMVSNCIKIRHVFGFTQFVDGRKYRRAGPLVITQLSALASSLVIKYVSNVIKLIIINKANM